MAKLFEEVLNGTALAPSADLFIHFGCQSDVAPAAFSITSNSTSRSHDHHAQEPLPFSPRAVGGPPGVIGSTTSPARYVSHGGVVDHTPAHHQFTSLRCHTLVLRTQPQLINTLMAHSNKAAAETWPKFSGVAEAIEGDCHANVTEISRSEGIGAVGSGYARRVDDAADASDVAPEPRATSASASNSNDSFPLEANGLSTIDGGMLESASERKNTSVSHFSPPDRNVEVTVDDEPEIFLEMIKFVYLHSCHVDRNNVKALMLIADKYGVEDIVKHCLQWVQENFTASLFYHFLSFKLLDGRFRQLLRQSLLIALRSRRQFFAVTVDAQWEGLPVGIMQALLSSDELPVVSELEVLQLLARWAAGSLNQQNQRRSTPSTASSEDDFVPQRAQSPGGSSVDSCNESVTATPVKDVLAHTQDGPQAGLAGESTVSKLTTISTAPSAATNLETSATSPLPINKVTVGRQTSASSGLAETSGSGEGSHGATRHTQDDMLKLLKTFRNSDMSIKISDLDPILEILQLNSLFSTKPPRETSELDPGFMIYRGVAGVNVPAPFGDLNQPNVVQETWRGSSVSLGCRDFAQQREGFRPNLCPEEGFITFPRLWVRIKCSSWSHREKRTSKSTTNNLSRHSMSGHLGGDVTPPLSESASFYLPSVTEAPSSQTLRVQSQDDWEIGRTRSGRSANVVPNITDNEKIEHKVICAVISGHMRHGIRIGQRDRCSLYDIEELNGQCDEVCLGGTPNEVEFELQLTAEAPNHCGICRCTLAVLPAGVEVPSGRCADPLQEIAFDVSAEEHMRFYISSSHFDSNSSFGVALNWVLRPGFGVEASSVGNTPLA